MSNTNNLSIDLLASNQAQKEITANEAFSRIDAVLNVGALTMFENTPASSPAEGDLHVVGASPTGKWASNANEIAYYNSGWKFVAPKTGMRVWSVEQKILYVYESSAWKAVSYSRTHVETISSSSNALVADLENSNVFYCYMDENITSFSLVNCPSSSSQVDVVLYLKQDSTGGRSFSNPASFNFIGGVAPTLNTAADAMNILNLRTIDGGTNWFLEAYVY